MMGSDSSAHPIQNAALSASRSATTGSRPLERVSSIAMYVAKHVSPMPSARMPATVLWRLGMMFLASNHATLGKKAAIMAGVSTTSNTQRAWRAGEPWSTTEASELYEVGRWGKGYFSVSNAGHLVVHPTKEPERSIDLKQLVDHLQLRGIGLPILIRFRDILRQRLADIHGAFQTAITQNQYDGKYFCVYPIKVNQQRQVVEEVLEFGRPYGFGLEAGSKPELLAVMAQAHNNTPIICNGFKDAEYIEMAMLAQKVGRNIIPVVEKYTELGLILKYAERVGVRPQIGMRVKLAARGSGRCQGSGGYRSKFGLTVAEVLRGLEELKGHGMQDCFKLLHFHLGSQIPNIRIVKGTLNEAARIYTALVKAGAGTGYHDVAGGLGRG